MLRLYDYFESGNCYKIRLLLSQLGESYIAVVRKWHFMGEVELARFPSVTAWIGRVAAEPGHGLITDAVGDQVTC